jgi:predicted FMN-binding regulatory protein PaiB
MYNLPYFKEENHEVVLEFMRKHPFVFLTGVNEGINPLPLKYLFLSMKEKVNYFLLAIS